MSTTRTIVCCLAMGLVASALGADWLVTREGERIETQGPWEVKKGTVVFTLPSGTLSSLRLSAVDLEASEALTAEAARPAPPPPPAGPPPPVLTITDKDIRRGAAGASGPDFLAERLRSAHSAQELEGLMDLVYWEGVSPGVRAALRSRFEQLLEQEILDVQIEAAGAADGDEYVHDDGTTYRPNLTIIGRLAIQLQPNPEFDNAAVSFPIGENLGTYYIAAAAPVE